jgi:hypothetical protein
MAPIGKAEYSGNEGIRRAGLVAIPIPMSTKESASDGEGDLDDGGDLDEDGLDELDTGAKEETPEEEDG